VGFPVIVIAHGAIHVDPVGALRHTAGGAQVHVVADQTAAPERGANGAPANKPVMEGTGDSFKTFAGVGIFDIEFGERDPDQVISIIDALELATGGINFEHMMALKCFCFNHKLCERFKISDSHSNQHDTAINVGAALTHGPAVLSSSISVAKLMPRGAGATAG
jgi:malate dehydrogenase (oxaloacetate-decarboxylating)(NADP+)